MPVNRSNASRFIQATITNAPVGLGPTGVGFSATEMLTASRCLISVDTGALRVLWDNGWYGEGTISPATVSTSSGLLYVWYKDMGVRTRC